MERHLRRAPARPLPVVARPVVGPVAAAGRNARRRFPRGAHALQRGPLERDLRRYLPSKGHILDVGAVVSAFPVHTNEGKNQFQDSNNLFKNSHYIVLNGYGVR